MNGPWHAARFSPVAAGISAEWVVAVEAFDPVTRVRPADDAPLIETILFMRRSEVELAVRGEKLYLVKDSKRMPYKRQQMLRNPAHQ